ncbi:MAG: biotin-independent malonate decarboxylase subunit beta [Gammaproteobacteria bacterium]|nr:biotin-independent malonate decarboxylase subunit beta [Gammaproteobacteria bacterium]MBU1600769.1 biotin-independent malonate decarboxylase subunit beta [Gammaproteobacteria bacterium]MBU2435225.1 biotin-independent malonate decarboxylase subunit beta [Gammaproteobacteria bacterium]MBU2448639.1 biotin-independent malonate decarboxylase subunit beta [Gammaproteobacteria bacterium]
MIASLAARHSWFEATARARLAGLLDPGSFSEILPPAESNPSPHLALLDLPGAFDDGVVVCYGQLGKRPIFAIAQEGQFMGGAVGEIHGAKIVGMLRRAAQEKPAAVLFLIDSGGVRLHEANAGLIAISEIMRAVLDARAAGVPVIALVGGSCGAFGGMGIVAKLCSAIVISEEGRLALSGPEVIETVAGVEEFDSKDRALVWRVTGGKHRYLMGDCAMLVEDDIAAFRSGATEFLAGWSEPVPSVAHLRAGQQTLENRLAAYASYRDGLQVWAALGVAEPESVPLLDRDALVALKEGLPT